MVDDLQSFRQVVERHQSGLFAFVRSLGLDAHGAEDVVQDAFLSAWRHRGTFDASRGSLRAWIFGIARNGAINAMRKKRPVHLAILPEEGTEADTEPVEFARLDGALRAQPMDQRAAFVLAEIHGLTHEEVAGIEGVPVGTIKSRTARAREKLRAALEAVREETS